MPAKILLPLILMLVLLGGCSESSNQNSSDASAATEAETGPATPPPGTMDTGGSPFKPEANATGEDVRRALIVAKQLVPFVLKYLDASRRDSKEINMWFNPDSYEAYTEMINAFFAPQKEDIYDYYRTLEWEVREQEPCRSREGAPMAASAFPFEKRSICISIEMVRQNAIRENLVRRMLVLIVHELMHKRGIFEEEAVLRLENKLLRDLPEDPLTYLRVYYEQVDKLLAAPSDDEFKAWMANPAASPFPESVEGEFVSITSFAMRALRALNQKNVDHADLNHWILRLQQSAFALKLVRPLIDVPLELFSAVNLATLQEIEKEAESLRPTTELSDLRSRLQKIYDGAQRTAKDIEDMPFSVSSRSLRRHSIPQ